MKRNYFDRPAKIRKTGLSFSFLAEGLAFGTLIFTLGCGHATPNSTPIISSASPTSFVVGASSPPVITVIGSGFVAATTAQLNGQSRPVTFSNGTHLSVTLNAQDVTTAASDSLTLSNPAPGGGSSNAVPLMIDNPQPQIASLLPANILVSSGAVTVSIAGVGFEPTSTVTVDGAIRASTFISVSALTVNFSAAEVQTAATHQISVSSPAPGGGSSNVATLAINNPQPQLTSVSPANILVSSGAITVSIAGANFVPATTVLVDGQSHASNFVSSSSISLNFSATEVQAAVVHQLSVISPAPGGGSSRSVSFAINNPEPQLSSLSPSSVIEASGAVTVNIVGDNFLPTSTVLVDGQLHTSNFVSSSAISLNFSAAEVQTAVVHQLSVVSPAPGGGSSSSVSFAINNPDPQLSSLSPSSVIEASGAVTVNIVGENFLSASTVLVDGQLHASNFVSSAAISLDLSAAEVDTPAVHQVAVVSPAPGGGVTGPLVFQVSFPAPTETSLIPASVLVQSPPSAVTIAGVNFLPSSTVLWDGVTRSSVFVSSASLSITPSAADLQTASNHQISVTNPSPGGGTASLTFVVNNPQPSLFSAAPTSFASGPAAGSVTLQGANFLTGATAAVSGQSRSSFVNNSGQLTFSLAPTDLLFATTLPVTVLNPAPSLAPSAPVTVAVTNQSKVVTYYIAYGDSITEGYTIQPSQAYPALLAANIGFDFFNWGQVGQLACDLFPGQLYLSMPLQEFIYATEKPGFSVMIGTNDIMVKGTGAYEPVYENCYTAALAWLALRPSDKSAAGSSNLQSSGGCSQSPDANHLGTLYCSAPGSITQTAFPTTGAPLYVWYYMDDAATGDAFTVTVDGVSQPLQPVAPSPALNTGHFTASIGVIRIPIPAGTHSMLFTTTTGSAGLLGWGSFPATSSVLPPVIIGDIPDQLQGFADITPEQQQQYTVDIQAMFHQLYADGADVRYAPTQLYMLGAPNEMSDFVHPNVLGHQHLYQAFSIAFSGITLQ